MQDVVKIFLSMIFKVLHELPPNSDIEIQEGDFTWRTFRSNLLASTKDSMVPWSSYSFNGTLE